MSAGELGSETADGATRLLSEDVLTSAWGVRTDSRLSRQNESIAAAPETRRWPSREERHAGESGPGQAGQ